MKQAKVLSSAELKRVLKQCQMMRYGARNRLAVMLSHYAGLRVGELVQLCWSDVLDSKGDMRDSFYLLASQTKAGEARLVYLPQKLRRELEQAKNGRADGPIMRSQKGGAIDANSMGQVLARLYCAAGIANATSHSGRRWFITSLAHKGVSAKVIMELAGHKHLSTTQRYIDVTPEMMKTAVEGL